MQAKVVLCVVVEEESGGVSVGLDEGKCLNEQEYQ